MIQTTLGGLGIAIVVVVSVVGAQAPNVVMTFDFGSGTPETVTLTAREVAALQAEVDAVNTRQRVDENPWTIEQWHALIFRAAVDQAMVQSRQIERDIACERFRAMTLSERMALLDRLDGANPFGNTCEVTR